MIKIFRFVILINIVMLLSTCGKELPQFNGDQAYQILMEQCELGPRPPGSSELQLCRDYIISELDKHGAVIEKQGFEVEYKGDKIDGINILASFYPQMGRRILLGAHYDTRPWSDKDTDPANHDEPVLGANDGASGVAVLLELARILSQEMPSEFGIDMVFFDLEDMGTYTEEESWCLGSSYFAEHYNGALPEKAIVVDMIGDKDLSISIEHHSYINSPLLVREIWDTAKQLGIEAFKNKIETAIQDDHLPLIKIGINAAVIIDFEYKWWHTVSDTPDKCSPASLSNVGDVLVYMIYGKN